MKKNQLTIASFGPRHPPFIISSFVDGMSYLWKLKVNMYISILIEMKERKFTIMLRHSTVITVIRQWHVVVVDVCRGVLSSQFLHTIVSS